MPSTLRGDDDFDTARPGASSDPGLGFGTWRTPNPDRPTFVCVDAVAQTDGTSDASISLLVDESGGMAEDYDLRVCWADAGLGSNGRDFSSLCTIIPAGASYNVENTADPNAGNAIDIIREFTL